VRRSGRQGGRKRLRGADTSKVGHHGQAKPVRTINLDAMFRSTSGARRIADRLMTGKPQTKYELVEGLNVSVTTVYRVVDRLEQAGAIITREIGSNGRQTIFRLVDVSERRATRPYLQVGERVRVVAARVSGDDMLVDVATGRDTYRGVVRGVITNVNMGGYATVQAVERVDDTLSSVRFEAHGASSGDRVVVLESVRNVTDAQ
jgi:predicted ArsR family transcriptional regulator